MRNEFLTEADISGFRMHLQTAEKSAATEQKYIRDVRAFAKFIGCSKIIIGYKKPSLFVFRL